MAASLDATTATGGDTFTSSKTVNAPAGAAAGKVVVITVETWTGSAEPTVTNWAALGFTEVAAAHATMVTTSSPGNQSIRKAVKVLSAADASWNLTFSATCWNAATAELWSGIDTANPVDAASTATGSTGYPNAAVTTSAAGAAVSNSAGTTQAVTTTPPTGYTERQDNVTLHTNTQVAGAAGSVPGSGGTVSANGEICVSTLALKAASSGSNYTQTPTDAEGLTDSATAASAFGRAQTDPLGLTDTVAATSAFGTVQTDPLGLTDAGAPVSAFGRAQTDDASLTDSVVVAGDYPRTQADLLSLTDGVLVENGKAFTPTDVLGLTDGAVTASAFGRVAADTLGLADAVALDRALSASDSAGLVDSFTRTLAMARVVADTATMTDLAVVELYGPSTPYTAPHRWSVSSTAAATADTRGQAPFAVPATTRARVFTAVTQEGPA